MSETFTGADIAAAASATPAPAAAPETTAAVSTPSPTASASAPATAAPVDDDSPDTPVTGPLPPERHKRILENARKKEREVAEREWQTTHQSALDRDREYAADPAAYAMRLLQQLEADPQHGSRLRSEAARILGARRAAQPAADARPEADVPTVDEQNRPGRMVYSDAQLQKLLEWNDRRAKQDILQELAPLRDAHTRAEQERQFQGLQQQASSFAASTLDVVGKLPGFADHAKTILDRYAALPTVKDPRTGWDMPDPRDPRTEDRKLLDIYHDVVLPTFQQRSDQTAVQTLQQKARATTLNPGSASAAEPFNYKTATWAETFAHEYAKKRGSK